MRASERASEGMAYLSVCIQPPLASLSLEVFVKIVGTLGRLAMSSLCGRHVK